MDRERRARDVHDGLSDGTTGAAEFRYDKDLGVGGGVPLTAWEFSTEADATQTVTMQWKYTGHHSFFNAHVELESFVDGFISSSGFVVNDTDSCCLEPSAGFTYCGSTSFDVEAGDTYGFHLRGSNGDLNSFLHGDLEVYVNDPIVRQCTSNQTVTTADDHDDGTCTAIDCTLREAIDAANAQTYSHGGDRIGFQLGASPQPIILGSALPLITAPVAIDGLSRPGVRAAAT